MRTFILILFFCPYLSFAQHDKNWLLSYDGGSSALSNNRLFLTWNPTLQIDSIYSLLNQYSCTITMSDSSGNYIFASNGANIMDRSGHLMLNGDNLNMSPCSTAYAHTGTPMRQALLSLPMPGDTNLYYLFHETCEFSTTNYTPLKLMYSTIDMRGNNGFGQVVQKNIDVFYDSLTAGDITACKHSDGNSWWIMIPHLNSNIYNRVLFSRYGIIQHDTISCGPDFQSDFRGKVVFSPDGKFFARSNATNGLCLMQFDRCTGTFNEIFRKGISDFSWPIYAASVEFSQKSTKLYFCTARNVYQYDLTASNIATSETVVATWDSINRCPDNLPTNLAYCQLAPDGKIYINATNGGSCLNYIEYPDSLGLSCNVIQRGILLPFYISIFSSFPNTPHYNLGPDGQDCGINFITNQEVENISIFPNPTSTNLYLSGLSGEKVNISIRTLEGKILEKIEDYRDEKPIDVSLLLPGVYLFSISNMDRMIYKRLVISR